MDGYYVLFDKEKHRIKNFGHEGVIIKVTVDAHSRQQNVCAMVARHQGMKFSFYITFAHVDRTRFQ
jgi:hypothetical protein